MKFEDQTTRHLETILNPDDTAKTLVDELIVSGLINEVNRDDLITVLEDSLKIRDEHEEKDVSMTYHIHTQSTTVVDTSSLSDCSMSSSGCSSTCYPINSVKMSIDDVESKLTSSTI